MKQHRPKVKTPFFTTALNLCMFRSLHDKHLHELQVVIRSVTRPSAVSNNIVPDLGHPDSLALPLCHLSL